MNRRRPKSANSRLSAPLRWAAFATLLICLPGCGLAMPNWFQPGHLYHQRLRATHFDPYGDIDAAPDFDGSRPREFQRPRSQSEKSQWFMGIPPQ